MEKYIIKDCPNCDNPVNVYKRAVLYFCSICGRSFDAEKHKEVIKNNNK